MPGRAALAKIHIAKKELGLSDDLYRGMLHDYFKCSSSKDLSDRQAGKLIGIFKEKGWKPKAAKSRKALPVGRAAPSSPGWHGRTKPSKGREGQINKIIRLCALLGKLGPKDTPEFLAYADGVAKKQLFRNQPDVKVVVEHLDSKQLRAVISALNKQCKRENAPGWEP